MMGLMEYEEQLARLQALGLTGSEAAAMVQGCSLASRGMANTVRSGLELCERELRENTKLLDLIQRRRRVRS